MKAIVTGAYGLVGSHLCKALEAKGIEVFKVKFNELDGLPMVDYIVHAAGYGQPLKFLEDEISTIGINTETTRELFNYLKSNGKYLFISTSELYSGAKSPHTESDIGTTNPQHPRACYIEGKRCGEAIVMAYRRQGYDAKIARLALAYGEGTKPHDTRVLNQFIEQALTTDVIHLKDKGEAIRTYCYIDDVVGMLLDILFKGTRPVYNVGGFSTVTVKELAEKIAEITKSSVVLGDEGLKGAPEDVKLNMLITLAEFPREFTTLEEGLRKTIDYQKTLYA